MALSDAQRAELESLGPENARRRLDHAGGGPGSIVPGFSYPGVLRGDLEDWLSVQDRAAANALRNTLWWAKASAWIGIAGIGVAIIIALSGRSPL
jgi:hypothetical protein